jgi:hypothetical protein
VITTTQFVKTNEESVKQKSYRQNKAREIQIAQHELNSKTDYEKQHTSSRVT